jgi:hypothetical protein
MSITAHRAPRASLEDHVELSQFELHPPSIRLLPQQFCIKNQVIILDQVDTAAAATSPILVAMLRKDDLNLIDQVRLHLKREIEPVQLSSFEIRKALSIAFGDETSPSKSSASQTLQVKPTSLFETAAERAASGETSVEEVCHVIPYRSLQIAR